MGKPMLMPGNVQRGFTVIELVSVIVLLGIVGTFVLSRFTSPSAFNQGAITDALIAGIRQAQQAALGRSGVTFGIVASADEYRLEVKAGADLLSALSVPSSSVVLQTGTAEALTNPTDSCASGTRFDDGIGGFVIAFDNQGNIDTFDYDANPLPGPQQNGDPLAFDFNGVRICVNDLVAASVCVSPAGYAYEGDCDP